MLEIRLSRIGKKKKPLFRLIISEKTKDTKGDFLELLGFYNPHTKTKLVNLKKERIQYWLSCGAQTSATVHNLLIKNGVIRGKKIKKDKAKKETGEPAQSAQGGSGGKPKEAEIKKEPTAEQKPEDRPKADQPQAEKKAEEVKKTEEVKKEEVKKTEEKKEAPAEKPEEKK